MIELTDEELELILEHRRKSTKQYIPVKRGYLKHNLYTSLTSREGAITEDKLKTYIEKFKKSFTIDAKKGDEFLCYKYDDKEIWSDVNSNYEISGESWLSENLENIQSIEHE